MKKITIVTFSSLLAGSAMAEEGRTNEAKSEQKKPETEAKKSENILLDLLDIQAIIGKIMITDTPPCSGPTTLE